MKEDQYFLKIPNSVLYTDPSKLTWLEKVIVSYRLSYGDKFYASNEHVAEQFFTTKKTVMQAYQKARDCGILPPEQMLMDTIITQSGSHFTVTGSYDNVINSHFTVTGSHLQVSGSHFTVTDESPIGERKEAVSPMKNDLLLDQCIRTMNKNNIIKPVILPKLDGDLQIILKGSKLPSYHRTSHIYKNNLKPNHVYSLDKGWYIGLSQTDYDKASNQIN